MRRRLTLAVLIFTAVFGLLGSMAATASAAPSRPAAVHVIAKKSPPPPPPKCKPTKTKKCPPPPKKCKPTKKKKCPKYPPGHYHAGVSKSTVYQGQDETVTGHFRADSVVTVYIGKVRFCQGHTNRNTIFQCTSEIPCVIKPGHREVQAEGYLSDGSYTDETAEITVLGSKACGDAGANAALTSVVTPGAGSGGTSLSTADMAGIVIGGALLLGGAGLVATRRRRGTTAA